VYTLTILSRVRVSGDGVLIYNRIDWTLKQHVTTNNYDSLTELHIPKVTVTTAHIKNFSVFTRRCLVAASSGGCCPFSGFQNCPRPRFIASPRTARKTSLPLLRVLTLPGKHVSTDLFPSNGCCTVACLKFKELILDNGSTCHNMLDLGPPQRAL
jgi:hypothetical protein